MRWAALRVAVRCEPAPAPTTACFCARRSVSFVCSLAERELLAFAHVPPRCHLVRKTRFMSKNAVAVIVSLLTLALLSVLAGCKECPKCVDCGGASGRAVGSGSPPAGAGGAATVPYSVPVNVPCPTGVFTTDCKGDNPLLPPCAKWTGCVIDANNQSICVASPKVDCMASEAFSCTTSSVTSGVLTCDTACRLNPVTGVGGCRPCGGSGQPCCIRGPQCQSGVCVKQDSGPNYATGTCP
jgi:hypothetical protein